MKRSTAINRNHNLDPEDHSAAKLRPGPIQQRYFQKNPAMQRIIDEQVDALLEQRCIEPSHSLHSAGLWLMCVDYRQLNAKSIPDA